jgi:hypothetical protein
MTNRPTFHSALKIPQHGAESQLFEFKEHDSYCYCSSFTQGGGHV